MKHNVSFLTKQFLQEINPGSFTLAEIGQMLADAYPDEEISLGAVSGFLHRAVNADALTVGNIDGRYTYAVRSKKALAGMNVREVKGDYKGGATGRNVSKKAGRIPTTESIQSRLLDIAAELEQARTPLAAFSTEELLGEISRRMEK